MHAQVKAAHHILPKKDAKLPEGSVDLLLRACKACLDNLVQFEVSEAGLHVRNTEIDTTPEPS